MTLKLGVHVDVLSVERVGDFTLRLSFSDGHESVVDFRPFLFASMNDETRQFLVPEKFGAYRIEWGNLVWGDYEMSFPVEDLYLGRLVRRDLLAVAETRDDYQAGEVRQ